MSKPTRADHDNFYLLATNHFLPLGTECLYWQWLNYGTEALIAKSCGDREKYEKYHKLAMKSMGRVLIYMQENHLISYR